MAALADLRAPSPFCPALARIAPDRILGGYRIVREIGRGGMGVVFEAEDVTLRRRVALKVLPDIAARDPRQLARFRIEVHAASTLGHPNIVPILAVGSEADFHYFAMPLIAGRTLAQLIAARRSERERSGGAGIEPAEAARLGIQAAEALEHAHAMGILHRDIKPGNLLLDDSGRLWVLDFGLARLQAGGDVTATGDVIGTLRYMSPEQALARGVLGPQSDIYSLGVTIYEMLVLRPAVNGRDRHEILRRIADDEPPALRRIDRAIPAALESVILKAIAREPRDRYASAGELADDLRRFLEGRPILARPRGMMERAGRWMRRHRAAVVTAAVLLLAALGGSTVGSVMLWREQHRTVENLDLALKALGHSLDFSEDELVENPGRAEAVQESLRQALALYQRLARQNASDLQVRWEIARAYRRVGDLRAGLGRLEDAEDAYRSGDAALAELLAPRSRKRRLS